MSSVVVSETGSSVVVSETANSVVVSTAESSVTIQASTIQTFTGPRQWFVSSSGGSDSNNGRSPDEAFLTLAKAVSEVEAGDEILLKCGDVWREQIDEPELDGITIASYGYGRKPTIDCSDDFVIGSDGWTETYDSDLDTWYASKNLSSIATTLGYGSATNLGKIHVGIYENDRQLEQTDTAIQSAGSFHVATTGSRNIRTLRNAHDDGSLVLGLDATIEDCDCEDGHKHNCFVESGYLKRVRCSVANKRGLSTETGMRAGTMFVAFRTDPSSLSVTYDECSVYGGSSFTDGLFGFYFHGAPNAYGTVIVRNCHAESVDFSIGGDYKNLLVTGSRFTNCKSLVFGGNNAAGTKTVIESSILNTGIVSGDRVVESKTATTTMSNCEIVARWLGSTYMIDAGDGQAVTYTFSNCAFVQHHGGSQSQLGIIKVRSGQRLNMTSCCLFQSDEATSDPDASVTPIVVVDTGATYLSSTSNNNLYHAGYKVDTTSPRRVRFERLGATFICETSPTGANGNSRWVNESGGAVGTFDGADTNGPVLPYSTRTPQDGGPNPTVAFRGLSDASIPIYPTPIQWPKSSWVNLGDPAKRYGPIGRSSVRQFYTLQFNVRP